MSVVRHLSASVIVFFGFMLIAEAAPSPPDRAMVLIPSGEFVMGKERKGRDFDPLHRVRISAFYLDKYEVTNAQWQAFCDATGRKLPDFWGMEEFRCGSDFPNHPVIGISWSSACAYARWCGLRLPTEAEWEYASRGGLVGKNFANGDEYDDALYAKGITMPVGSYPPNGYGLYDMTGNVAEWVNDYYDENYYSKRCRRNPHGPKRGIFRVVRGGGWHTGPWCSRVYVRNALKSNWVDFNVGFRCARHLEGSAAHKIETVLENEGVKRALETYRDIRRKHRDEYYVLESDFNDLGYRLLGDQRIDEALAVFKLVAREFPKSANAYDSLGEAYLLAGDRKRAIKSYRKSLKLNPNNRGAQEKLKELGAN